MMLHTKYQDSRPCGFRQEDFFHVFPISIYVKHVTSGLAHFWPQGHNFNKFGRGPLTKCQDSRLCGFRKKAF